MSRLDETHDPARVSWVEGADGHPDFPIQNLPLGVFSVDEAPRGGVAIGDFILDLAALADSGLLSGEAQEAARAASGPELNALLEGGEAPRRALRRRISDLLSDPAQRERVESMLHRANDCRMHLPARIGDYTDFYVGIHHALNVGRLFRPDAPLLPNYKHVPIGYHGRASSVRPTGAPVIRPSGQLKAADADPIFAPSRRLDFELELGAWIGGGSGLGRPIPLAEAERRLAGLCLLNDWSARDIQAWEYQPLGPFLSKNFLTTVSPWIVTAEALEPYRTAPEPRPAGDPTPLPYLDDPTDRARGGFAIDLEVRISTRKMREEGIEDLVLSRSHARHMYWTVGQMIAHHASNGCDLRSGDLLGTGTLSAPTADGFGSLLELTRGGAEPLSLPGGETRAFLEDGDEIALSGRLSAPGFVNLGFGECRGRVVAG
ncbi:fumarylacetoacetase [Brevundimonas faecalis]|uniref:fumarylacetoacetase n=1 Tax=Brevundimonas faecalis TaxID=947378 RepID=UPI00361F3438